MIIWQRYNYTSFITEINPVLAIEIPLIRPVCPSDKHHSRKVSLNITILSGTTRWASLILYISCPSSESSYFSKEPWFSLLQNGFRNHLLSIRYACCSWGGIDSLPFNWPNKAIYVLYYICAYTHIYKYFYMQPSLSTVDKHDFILMSPTLIHHHTDHFNLFSLFICNWSYSNSECAIHSSWIV